MAEQTPTPAATAADAPQPMAPAAPAKKPVRTVMQPGAAQPHHYKNGRLTREGMLHVIRNGGSFTWHKPMKNADGTPAVDDATGKPIMQPILVNSLDAVPSAADLAGQSGNADDVERVRKANEAEIERLRRENAALKANTPPAPPASQNPPPPAKK